MKGKDIMINNISTVRVANTNFGATLIRTPRPGSELEKLNFYLKLPDTKSQTE